MRFGAIFSAALSFGLLVIAAPTAGAGVAVRGVPVDLAVREVVAPVARFEEPRELTQLEAREDFLSTCQGASNIIAQLCADITVKVHAKADVQAVLSLWAKVYAQLQIISNACASIDLSVNPHLCVTLLAHLCVTLCTCIKLCLSVDIYADACAHVCKSCVNICGHILAAVSLHLPLFAAAFLKACSPDVLSLCASVGLNIQAILGIHL
ncbi:hypothetical protein BOTBODRAFT_35221 [Botryobasidium botryosum FD-172 SS1]|uniref:Transmembrane protein n=1 Tax=Botryobasidium botryosum (strain FD-172 SS1) TaxID=930990 RepID=A0A067MA24_BOTB1|nr:hypothetical protein BOTBODRAFT_35221 [Botryobasidium botryosum FD-172 SS1]